VILIVVCVYVIARATSWPVPRLQLPLLTYRGQAFFSNLLWLFRP